MARAMEMETLGINEKIEKINEKMDKIDKIDKNNDEMMKKINKNEKLIKAIIIPMLGVIIISCGLVAGVLSGYIFNLPHKQNDNEPVTSK